MGLAVDPAAGDEVMHSAEEVHRDTDVARTSVVDDDYLVRNVAAVRMGKAVHRDSILAPAPYNRQAARGEVLLFHALPRNPVHALEPSRERPRNAEEVPLSMPAAARYIEV
jgi:hypothetical protein